MNIKAWIEEHPYLTGSAVLAIIVLFLVSRSSGSSSGGTVTTVNAGPSEAVQVASLQAATQAASVQAAAQSQQNQLNAQLAAKQLDNATQTTIAQMTLQYNIEKLKSEASVQNNANNFAYQIALSNNDTQAQINKQNNDASVQIVKSNNSLWSSIYTAILGGGTTTPVSTPPVSTGQPLTARSFDTPLGTIPPRTGANAPQLPRIYSPMR